MEGRLDGGGDRFHHGPGLIVFDDLRADRELIGLLMSEQTAQVLK